MCMQNQPLGHIRISDPHDSRNTGFGHIDVEFVNPRYGYRQLILPYNKIHVPSPCQPDFDPIPGWQSGPKW